MPKETWGRGCRRIRAKPRSTATTRSITPTWRRSRALPAFWLRPGRYDGTLRDLVVDGNVDVPDFRLPQFGNAVVLHTTFHAKVDGTDGDTWLDPVDATLGHSHFVTRGQVVRVRPPAAAGTPTGDHGEPAAPGGLRTRYRFEGGHRPRAHRGFPAPGESFANAFSHRVSGCQGLAAHSSGHAACA